jgi:hypothetical protein
MLKKRVLRRIMTVALLLAFAVPVGVGTADTAQADSCWYYARQNGTSITYKYTQRNRWCGTGSNITTGQSGTKLVWNAYWGYHAYPTGGVMSWDGNTSWSSGCSWVSGIERCNQETHGQFHYLPVGPYAYPWHDVTVVANGSYWGSSGG